MNFALNKYIDYRDLAGLQWENKEAREIPRSQASTTTIGMGYVFLGLALLQGSPPKYVCLLVSAHLIMARCIYHKPQTLPKSSSQVENLRGDKSILVVSELLLLLLLLLMLST